MSDHIFSRGVAMTVLTLAVAACGGDGNGGGLGSGGGSSGPAADSFFNAVKAVVATSPDDSEPREIES
ncbi:MAG: hypothetical protein ABIR35_12425, partial [Polaromonas sp.]